MGKTNLTIIRYTGLFDFDAFYRAMVDWCKSYGFMWQEDVYKHKVPSPAGAEQEWEWSAIKEVTDYYQYKIIIKAHAWDLTEVEVTKNGKKKVLTSARIEILLNGEITLDWQGKFKKGKFNQFLGRMYAKMRRREIESNYDDTLYYRIWNLHALMKKFFDMQTKWHEYKRYLGEN